MRCALSSEHVPILLYHSVAAGVAATDDPWQVRGDDFRADMEAVAESGRTPMTAVQYASWLTEADSTGASPVLVTFDDGFADYMDVAWPVLHEFRSGGDDVRHHGLGRPQGDAFPVGHRRSRRIGHRDRRP